MADEEASVAQTPRPGREPESAEERFLAATAAGWDYETDPDDASFSHGVAPEIDPALGHNGVPAPVPGDPDFTGGDA